MSLYVYVMHLCWYEVKLPNLKLKTRYKQLLGKKVIPNFNETLLKIYRHLCYAIIDH